MRIFHRTINVSINTCESLVTIIISINGKPISKMNCTLQDDNWLLICDITPFIKKKYISRGYGSRMMDKLLAYASKNNIHTIHGNLSYVDKDHEERLHGFYEKYGFEIVLFKEPNDVFFGEVIKKL